MIPLLKQRGRRAFTLVEVLVSSVILLVILGLLLGMGERMSRFWHTSEGRRGIQREILAAIRTMEADLRHAALSTDPSTLVIKTSSLNPGTAPNSALFFLTSEEGSSEGGTGLSAVGFFVTESPTKAGHWNLYRFHAPEKETCEAVIAGTLPSLYAKASAADPSTSELLAENIVGLTVAEEKEAGIPPLLRISVTGFAGLLPHNATPAENSTRIAREGRSEISLVRLPPETASPAK